MSLWHQWATLRGQDCLEPPTYFFVVLKKIFISRALVHLSPEYRTMDSVFARNVAGFIISIMMVLTLCMFFCLFVYPSENMFCPTMAVLL